MNIKVDQQKCIGCGTCVAIAGKTFKFNDTGKVVVLSEVGDDAVTVKSAVESCPVQAIVNE
ncbi:MAG: ferredoxin [bacterium]